MTGSAFVLRADAHRIPLPDDSGDLIVTSPPYFALRSYRDAGEHYDGQIGSEPSPQDFTDALIECTAEMVRVLKPSGSIFVDLGDKYAGSGGHNNSNLSSTAGHSRGPAGSYRRDAPTRYVDGGTIRAKSLMLLPERYRIACIDQLGLIAREVIVWNKPNGLPESVRDRCRRSHEDWVHLVKSPKYFAAVDEIREPHAAGTVERYALGYGDRSRTNDQRPSVGYDLGGDEWETNPLGKLPGSVWTVPAEPLTIPQWAKDKYGLPDHFAAFPQEWPRRLILGWSPNGICLECGEGRFPVVDREQIVLDHYPRNRPGRLDLSEPEGNDRGMNGEAPRTRSRASILGYACACTPYTDHKGTGESSPTADESGRQGDRPVDIGATHRRVGPWREYHLEGWKPPATRPAVVLDPFGGTGTTAMVARALGRIGISIDLSLDYCRLARWRIFDSGHAKKAIAKTARERQGVML